MIDKESQYKSFNVMNIWLAAEMGSEKAYKSHKKLIRRQRRTLEKRRAEREIKEFV